MLRALWSFIKIAILIGALVWVADRPGSVEITLGDQTIQMHFGIFIVALLGAFTLALVIFSMFKAIASIPAKIAGRSKLQKHLKGYKALTLGLTAVAAGDAKIASYQAYRAQKFLPADEGLPLLLKAQAARLKGNDDDAQDSFEALTRNKDTAFIGLRGLLQAALDSGDHAKALDLARQALSQYSKTEWILKLTYDLEIRAGHWNEARDILKTLQKQAYISDETAQSDNVALWVAMADEQRAMENFDKALKYLNKAQGIDPDFAPIAQRLAQVHILNKNIAKARHVTEKAIKRSAHPDLIALWDQLIGQKLQKDPLGVMRHAEKLIKLAPKDFDVRLYLAEKAMDHGLWGEARTHLEEAENIRESAALYALNARLEKSTGGKAEDIAASESHAANGPPPKAWICSQSGTIYDRWDPVLPNGVFNTLIWDVPGSSAPIMTLSSNLPKFQITAQAVGEI